MKILMINSEKSRGSILDHAYAYLTEQFAAKNIETETVWLTENDLHGCVGCGKCWRQRKCIFNDAVNEVIEKAETFDGLIVGVPVYYGEPSKQVISFMDRLFHASSDRFARKPAACIPVLRSGRDQNAYHMMSDYFSLASMPVITSIDHHAIHVRDDSSELSEETVHVLDRLAQDMSWLMLCIENAKKTGISEPELPVERTLDFLR